MQLSIMGAKFDQVPVVNDQLDDVSEVVLLVVRYIWLELKSTIFLAR